MTTRYTTKVNDRSVIQVFIFQIITNIYIIVKI